MIVGLGGKADGVKTMLGREGFGLGQCFAGDGGDMRAGAVIADVKDQIFDGIGRRAIKRHLGLFAPRLIAKPCGVDRHVFDLIVRNQQLTAQAARL